MNRLAKHFDWTVLCIIAATLVLFALALFEKGFTHDLLLEAGVFLVSAKLILQSYHNSVNTAHIQQKLDEVLSRLGGKQGP